MDKQRITSVVRSLWPVIGLVTILGIVAFLTYCFLGRAESRLVTTAFVTLVLVLGLYIFSGNSGILSFGHIGFAAIGAYGAAWQTCCPASKGVFMPGLPLWLQQTTVPSLPALLNSGLLAAAAGLLVGLPITRLSGLAASIASFCFLAIVFGLFSNWQSVTSGTGSIVGVPTYVDVRVAWLVASAGLVIAFIYQRSRSGRMLHGVRDDEIAAQSIGVNVARVRLLAFVLSAFVSGVGGALHAHFMGIVSVSTFYLSLTFLTIAMLVVGGMRSLAGAVTGVIVVTAITEAFRALERGVHLGENLLALPRGTQEVAVGLVMLFILIVRPKGITNGRELPVRGSDERPQQEWK